MKMKLSIAIVMLVAATAFAGKQSTPTQKLPAPWFLKNHNTCLSTFTRLSKKSW